MAFVLSAFEHGRKIRCVPNAARNEIDVPSLVLDLETILDPEMPPYMPRSGSDEFPPAPYWQIVCIGLLHADDALCTKRIGCVQGDNEHDILCNFVRTFDVLKHPDIVTFNGRRFDLPVITARLMRHGIAMPARFARDVNYRFTDAGHFDVADVVGDYGAGRHASLDAWAKMIGMPGKLDVKGADVATMVANGELAKVQEYCMADVVQTHAVRLRFDLTRGCIDRAEYLEAMRTLLLDVENHKRLGALDSAITEEMRERLMLEEHG